MEDTFLSDGEPTDLFLANFVEDCQCVIAEIIRLQDFLPSDFQDSKKSRFRNFIVDFSYFNIAQRFEDDVAGLQDLEEEFYSRFGEVIKRFEILFHTIANLFHGLAEYSELVSKELFSSTDSTRELEADALFHLASVAFHVHKLFDGPTRERLFVAIFRISDDRKNVDFLVDFLRADVYPYPGTTDISFSRVRIEPIFIQSCISFLERAVRLDPSRLRRIGGRLPETLFGCLLFAVEVRSSDHLRMKYFIENFFRDSWVISLSLGLCVSVVDEWSRSPAAIAVCQNHFVGSRLQQLFREHNEVLQRKEYSPSDIVPEKFEVLIDWIQRVNVSFRWMMLHSGPFTTFGKPALGTPEAIGKFHERAVDFAIKLASFEVEFLDIYCEYMKQRKTTVSSLLEEVCSLIEELTQLFSGQRTSKMEKREKLTEWLNVVRTTLRALDLDDPENSGVLVQVRRKLCQVTEILDLRKNLSVSHFIEIIVKKLDALTAAVSTSSSGEVRVRTAAQAPYLWPLIDSWVSRIQSRLLVSTRTQPVRVLFRKLDLSIAGVCGHLKTEEKKELIGRAYSCFLEKRLRNVLQSVPEYLFHLVNEKVIPALQKKWEPAIEKSAMKELSDFSENLQLSEVTHSISNMSVGISRISLRKIGTIAVNPKELMEEGIRRELRKELPSLLALTEKEYKMKLFDLEETLDKSATSLSAFHRAFIYLCEHLGIEGHQLWWEEVEEHLSDVDCSLKVLPKTGSLSLISVVYFFMMKLTDPLTNSFHSNEIIWKDRRYGKETFSSRCTDLVERWVPSIANGVLINNIVQDSQKLFKEIFASLKSISVNLTQLEGEDMFLSKEFESLIKNVSENQTNSSILIAKVGQIALLLPVLQQSKQESARVRATILFEAVSSTNKGLLCDPKELPPSSLSMAALSRKLGIVRGHLLIPMSGHPSPHFAVIILSILISVAPKFGQKKDSVCEHSFRAGLRTLLSHVHQKKEFSTLCLELKQVQQGNKRLRYSIDDALLSRLLQDCDM